MNKFGSLGSKHRKHTSNESRLLDDDDNFDDNFDLQSKRLINGN